VPQRARDYAAALATALLLAQLLLAQLTLACAALLVLTGRVTRWRPHWLAVPAGAGLAMALAGGMRPALAGFAAWPLHLAAYLFGSARHPAGPAALLRAAGGDLPRQLPVALLAGAAEAGALTWQRAGTGWRPGLVAAVRSRQVTAALSAGRTATEDGCAIGVDPGTGRRAVLSWAQAEAGVLAYATDAVAAGEICLPVVCAALRRRMSVLVADLSGGRQAALAVRALGGSLGVRVGDLTASAEHLPAAVGQVIRRREAALAGGPAVVPGLTGVLASLADLCLHADMLAWLPGCERADPAGLAELIAAGRAAGCRVLLSTASASAAARLAATAEIVLAAGPVQRDLAAQLAATATAEDGLAEQAPGGRPPGRQAAGRQAAGRQAVTQALAAQRPGSFAILTAGRPRLGLAAVPIRPAGPR